MEELYGSLLVCAFLLGAFLESEVERNKKRYKKLEKRYNELAIKTGNPELVTTFISVDELEEIKKYKCNGQSVKAVKAIRKLTGMDLVEAKQYVDDL